jgi:hypothetical protein
LGGRARARRGGTTSPTKIGTGGREMCKAANHIHSYIDLPTRAYIGRYTEPQCRLGVFFSFARSMAFLPSYNDTFFKLARLMSLTSEAWQRLCRHTCALLYLMILNSLALMRADRSANHMFEIMSYLVPYLAGERSSALLQAPKV